MPTEYPEPVPITSALAYDANRLKLIEEVDAAMDTHPRLAMLIGGNPLDVMHTNHRNHVMFMSSQFRINQYDVMKKTVQWVVRSYTARGFTPEYFAEVLPIWKQAIARNLSEEDAAPILSVYDWMKALAAHEALSPTPSPEPPVTAHDLWREQRGILLQEILSGRHRDALELVKSLLSDKKSLSNVYNLILMPVLHEVGRLWETGRITVAGEHLATSIVIRIMASLYDFFTTVEYNKGRIILSASANENHEIGARMVADLLELEGWDVLYLGANTPDADLKKFLLDERPFLLGLSVTMPFNLANTVQLIDEIRADSRISETRIILGGQAIYQLSEQERSNLLHAVDAVPNNIDETIELADRWWQAG